MHERDFSRDLAHLGQAVLLHSQSHNGFCPDDLEALVSDDMFTQEYVDELAARATYLAKGLKLASIPPEQLLAVEKFDSPNDYLNVLRADGSVTAVDRRLLKKTTPTLEKPVKLRFNNTEPYLSLSND